MNKYIEKIYGAMPLGIQNFLISLYGKKLEKEKFGKEYHRYISVLKDLTRDKARLLELQNKQFIEFFHFALSNSKFYRNFYKDVDTSSIKTLEEISKLPILDKETLRQNIEDIYTIDKRYAVVGNTGGTTGKSLTVLFRPEDFQRRMAYLDWFKYIHGVNLGDRNAHFNGKSIIPPGQKKKVFWRDNKGINQRIYSSFFTSADNIPYYIENLNQYKPEVMSGFITTMYDIARFMDANGIEAEFRPKAIFTTSETLLPIHRDVLQRVFKAPVRNQYASSEGAPFIIECSQGHLHECIDTGVLEHLPSESSSKLIITSFHTHGTPLIRYDIGDNVTEANQKYVSGCELEAFPVVESIDGRKAESLFSPERGNINSVNLSNALKYLPNSIINIQFIQNSLNEIDIKIVADKKRYGQKQQEMLIHELRQRFGDFMRFNFFEVDEIPKASSGKYRMIINNLDS